MRVFLYCGVFLSAFDCFTMLHFQAMYVGIAQGLVTNIIGLKMQCKWMNV